MADHVKLYLNMLRKRTLRKTYFSLLSRYPFSMSESLTRMSLSSWLGKK